MVSVNKEVWQYLDNHITIKKNLVDDLINVRSLAKKIIEETHINCSLNAVISAIRRYDSDLKEHEHLPKVYALLNKAKILVRTKLASILLKKNEKVRMKLPSLYPKIDFEGGDTLRIFEVNKYIKIVIDHKALKEIRSMFAKDELVAVEDDLGELTIVYGIDITSTPGVFAFLANELAANNVSVVDSTICHAEHLIIVKEKNLQNAFNVISSLTTSKVK